MSATSVTTTIKFRSDTASNWTAADPVLQQGELGFEYDTLKFKIGNGIDCWNDIENPYLTSSASGDILISDKIVHIGDADTAIRFPEDDTFQVETAGGVRLKIDSSGNVGINSDSPNKKLEVRGALNGSDGVRINEISDTYHDLLASGGNFYIHADSKGDDGSENVLRFGVGSGGERMRIDSSGRLLVGTSTARAVASLTPSTQMESTVGNGAAISLIRNSNNANPSFLILGKSRGAANGDSTIVQQNDILGSIRFVGADGADLNSIAAEITAVVDATPGASDMPGRLMFSTTSTGASSPTERMRIRENGATNIFCDATGFAVRTVQTTAGGVAMRVANGATNTLNGTNVFLVRSDGDCENINNSYSGISDIKLKENIVDANSQWNDLKALQVRKYNFKAETGYNTHTQIGLIAQEVELVSPGLVSESIDKETQESTKSVNYSVLYMKAVKALQEAMERIEVLEQRLSDAGIN